MSDMDPGEELADLVPVGGFPAPVVGTLPLPNPLVMAPLAGYSSAPFRRLCRRTGAALTFTEMTSVSGLYHGGRKGLANMWFGDDERPVAIQLFGSDPGQLPSVMDIIDRHRPDIIDLNMGCPQKKVIRTGAGGALMDDVGLACSMVRTMARRSGAPVSVKIRSGPGPGNRNAPTVAAKCVEAGASMVTVHARYVSQLFTGRADHGVIREVVEALEGTGAVVIGNGDITGGEDALRMMVDTGCDGVMVGRAALARPGVLSEIALALENPLSFLEGARPPVPSREERIGTAIDLGRDLVKHYDILLQAGILDSDSDTELKAMKDMRKFLPHRLRAIGAPRKLNLRIHTIRRMVELEELLREAGGHDQGRIPGEYRRR